MGKAGSQVCWLAAMSCCIWLDSKRREESNGTYCTFMAWTIRKLLTRVVRPTQREQTIVPSHNGWTHTHTPQHHSNDSTFTTNTVMLELHARAFLMQIMQGSNQAQKLVSETFLLHINRLILKTPECFKNTINLLKRLCAFWGENNFLTCILLYI